MAEALGLPFVAVPLRYGRLAALPNRLLGASRLGLTPAGRTALRPPWPDLVIAAGRRSFPVARWLKRRGGGRLAQVMWPGSRADADLIAVPAHDGRGERPGVLTVTGAPHRVTPAALARAAAPAPLAGLPSPRFLCLIGGARRAGGLTAADARRLAERVGRTASAAGGSVLATASRRTPPDVADAFEAAFADGLKDVPFFFHRWRAAGDNPYFALLAAAASIVVTADSVAMCVEACATAAPVHVFPPAAGVPAKIARLHDDLTRRGRLTPLAALAPRPEPATPLPNPADAVARAIRARLFAEPPRDECPDGDRA